MENLSKAAKIRLFDFKSLPMRTFHMTWFAFFLCFLGWFGIAPLMAVVREELALTKAQIGNTIIASVAITILARLVIGWLCDRIGPRLSYAWLLILGAIPVMSIGFANSYETFLLFRLAIGVIGASFVITQYHTSVMFAPNVVGTANATTAGWGNLGNGVTQVIMPLLLTGLLALGVNEFWGWRIAMVVPGLAMMGMGIAYLFMTQDTPEGNYAELRLIGKLQHKTKAGASFLQACRDRRVWVLFIIYGACFGIELTINNIGALYFMDYFGLSLKAAGLVAGLFGLMNIFARTFGGIMSDRCANRWGLHSRVRWLFIALLAEGIALILFSRMTHLAFAIAALMLCGAWVQMANGATYAVVPFINKRALGAVAGIVGAGGNAGAVAAGFLFKGSMAWPTALMIIGGLVVLASFFVWTVRFSEVDEREVRAEWNKQLEQQPVGAGFKVEPVPVA